MYLDMAVLLVYCDISNYASSCVVIIFFFLSFILLPSFFILHSCNVSFYLFLINISNKKSWYFWLILFYILLKVKFYIIPLKCIPSEFDPVIIRYAMLIIDKFRGEFLLLVLLLHLSLETTYSFIHQIFFIQCCLLFIFMMNIK